MTFQTLAAAFEQSGAGTDDFKRLYKGAFELMKSDSANAALYFVIGVAAHAYVVQYEDQGVAPDISEAAKKALVSYCTKIGQALAADPATRLALLGEVASAYQFEIHNF
ncbi:MAG: hypothetical protein QMB55_14245 [Propionivibrio sp.]